MYACIYVYGLKSYINLCDNSDGATSTINAVTILERCMYFMVTKFLAITTQLICLAMEAIKLS